MLVLSCAVVLAALWAGAALAEPAPDFVRQLARGELAALGESPEIVAAVREQNARGQTMAEITMTDAQWRLDAGIHDYMRAMMEGSCGPFITSLRDSKPYFAEIFVMDDQGANVCMTDKTSDYWQGDEAKFKKSFAGGAGAVFVDEVEFDESTQAYLVQVSVPVMDGGRAIGAITFGVDVDKAE
ncbi:MAG: PDC sensor domain-containing protein [Desulfovibrionaceae bacterium]